MVLRGLVPALPPLGRRLLAEACGTFLLLFLIVLINRHAGDFAPLAVTFTLMALIFAFGFLSGAVFNPAVSFAFFLVGELTWIRALLYTAVQIVAAFCGAVTATFTFWDMPPVAAPDFSAFDPSTKVSHRTASGTARGAIVEFTLTTFLIIVILLIVRQKNNSYFGLAIGTTVGACAFAGGPLSSAVLNPAAAIALQLTPCVFRSNGGECTALKRLWVYVLTHTAAAVAGSVLFLLMNCKCARHCDGEDDDESERQQQSELESKAAKSEPLEY